VRPQLRTLLTAWRNSFPHSVKEMKKELSEGNLESWLIKLENRAGALSGSSQSVCDGILQYIIAL